MIKNKHKHLFYLNES